MLNLISDVDELNNIDFDKPTLLVGEIVCPTNFNKTKGEKVNYHSDFIPQLPIYPNARLLSFSEHIAINIHKSVAKAIIHKSKNTYIALDLLLRWSKKIKQHDLFVVIGLYKNDFGKIYTQQLTFEKIYVASIFVGNRLVRYEERETNKNQVAQYLKWFVQQNEKKHIFVASNFIEEIESIQSSNITFVGEKPFVKKHNIPLKLTGKKIKMPLMAICTPIVLGIGIFFGTLLMMKSLLNDEILAYDSTIAGVEEIFQENNTTASISLIQQRQYYLESLEKTKKPSFFVKQLINSINHVRSEKSFSKTQLIELLFAKSSGNETHSFSIKIAVPKSYSLNIANDVFQRIIVKLGKDLNVSLNSLSAPQIRKTNNGETMIFHFGGEFSATKIRNDV